MMSRKDRILETEIGRTRSHCVEKWLWKWLWMCRKADYRMKEGLEEIADFHMEDQEADSRRLHILMDLRLAVKK